ncbi:MAG TPA: hypothetical protein DHW39_06195, partial [Erysipelotrichaceae bacterium]|nr:hypothetical protein [Erysipelotrichaceae bacterium]
MNPLEQLKETLETHFDAAADSLNESDLEQLNALLDKIKAKAEDTAQQIAGNLSDENKEALKAKAKNIEKNKLTDQEQVRRDKMNALAEKGLDPFGQAYERTAFSGKIRADYAEKTLEELEALNVNVKIAGRIMSKRRMG